MVIEKICVKGYQSLYDVELEFGRFSVIFGESDVGKSAFYRAIRGLLTTEIGDDYISYGEDKCMVTFVLPCGDRITWTKRKKESSEYSFFEQGKTKIYRRAKQIPSEISQILRIFPIIVDGERVYPNLRGQFDRLFLLFDSSSKKARILGSLISNILLEGIRQANIKRNRIEADVRALSDLILDLESRQQFNWDNFLARIKATRVIADRIKLAYTNYGRLVDLAQREQELAVLVGVPVETIPHETLEETRKLYMFFAILKSADGRREGLQKNLEWIENEITKTDGLIKRAADALDLAKKEMTTPCPYCGKSIHLWEVLG